VSRVTSFQKVVEKGKPIVRECKTALQRSIPLFWGPAGKKKFENHRHRAALEYSGPTQ